MQYFEPGAVNKCEVCVHLLKGVFEIRVICMYCFSFRYIINYIVLSYVADNLLLFKLNGVNWIN